MGDDNLLPLMIASFEQFEDTSVHAKRLQIVEWMLQSGADPRQKLTNSVYTRNLWKCANKEATLVKVDYNGHSTISLAFAWLRALREQKGGANWSHNIKYLEGVVALISRTASSKDEKLGCAFGNCLKTISLLSL